LEKLDTCLSIKISPFLLWEQYVICSLVPWAFLGSATFGG